MNQQGPLSGVRVLDLTRVLSGPYATMILADLGADVVKIERPGRGDDTRAFGPPFTEGVSTYFLSINRGKRSCTLDLKDPGDRERLVALAESADVLVENFRPGVMERLGLGFDALGARNPRLVWCSISGFGSDRPGPGYDLMVQGMSGIPSITGDGAAPVKCGASVADLVAGMNAVQGVLAALYQRERTGRGGFVDVSMLDGVLGLLTYHASAWLNAGRAPRALGNAHPSIHPFRTYQVDGGWLNLAVGNDALFESFCGVIERPLHHEPRFAKNADRVEHRAALDAILEPLMRTRSAAAWSEALGAAGVPCGPMSTVPEALERGRLVTHEHPAGGPPVRTCALPFAVSGAPRAAARRAPGLGEHTDEVLSEWLRLAPGGSGDKQETDNPARADD